MLILKRNEHFPCCGPINVLIIGVEKLQISDKTGNNKGKKPLTFVGTWLGFICFEELICWSSRQAFFLELEVEIKTASYIIICNCMYMYFHKMEVKQVVTNLFMNHIYIIYLYCNIIFVSQTSNFFAWLIWFHQYILVSYYSSSTSLMDSSL